MITDFHTHILPQIDDGSPSAECSVAMLKQLAQQGIGRVVATPHFYPRYESPEGFLEKREAAQALLQEAMEKEKGLPELEIGAEVYFFRGISESDVLKTLTIGKKRCILIEMPPAPWSDAIFRELADIWEKHRIRPVIAHIDRYIRPFHTYGIPKRLAQLPVLVQANAEFFLQKATSGMAMRMLQKDQIHLLGSDCHNLTDRSPNLGEAVEKIRKKLGQPVLDRLRCYEESLLDIE